MANSPTEQSWYRYPVIAGILSTLILVLGWFFSAPNGELFGRSGSLVTTVSLVFLFSQYQRALADAVQEATEIIHNQLAELDVGPNSRPGRILSAQLEQGRRRIERNIERWQGAIVLIGTIVWGWGDLFYQLVHR
jgi:hypothetical protein